ncbi:flagellar basal body P-ring formation chaperone FlgA [Actibacterium sp. D379-3]
MRILLILLCLAAMPAGADTLVAARTVRSQAILGPGDLALAAGTVPGALTRPEQALGQEARIILYAGRPIRPGDIGPPAVIERNQIVTLHYRSGPLTIAAEARALDRAGVGDAIRVMNLASRSTVTGRVTDRGDVVVGTAFQP